MAPRRKIKAELSDDGGILSFDIYDPIDDWFGVSAKYVKDEIAKAKDAKTLKVNMNSPGGSVWEGFAIYNAVKEFKGEKVLYVDSLSASIASTIAMAFDKIYMKDGSFMMIHDAHSVTWGNEDDHAKGADLLGQISGEMARIYSERTGMDVDEIRDMMRAETWMTAPRAIELGFADSIEEEPAGEYSPAANAAKYVAAWHNAPEEIAKRFPKFCASREVQSAPVVASIQPKKEGAIMTKPTEPETPAKTSPTPAAPEAKVVPVGMSKADRERADTLATALRIPDAEVRKLYAKADAYSEFEAEALAYAKKANAEADKDTPVAPPVARGGEPGISAAAPALADALLMSGGFIDQQGRMYSAKGDKAKLDVHSDAAKFSKLGLLGTVRALSGGIGLDVATLDNESMLRAYAERTQPRASATTAGLNTTSNFSTLLENALNKMILYVYETSPRTWDRWCEVIPTNDYRVHNLHKVSGFADLARLNEAGEVETIQQPDSKKELLTPFDYAGIFGVTDQVIVNNDTGYVIGSLSAMAEAALTTVEKVAWYTLLSNPTMNEDSEQLFSVAHSNTGTDLQGPSKATLDAIVGSMIVKKGLNGEPLLGNRPLQLLIPGALEGRTMEFLNSRVVPGQTNDVDNIYRGQLEPIVSPYLDLGVSIKLPNGKVLTASGATDRWYAQSRYRAIAIGFVGGNRVPRVRQERPIGILGTKLEVSTAFGVAAAEWRGIEQWTNDDPSDD